MRRQRFTPVARVVVIPIEMETSRILDLRTAADYIEMAAEVLGQDMTELTTSVRETADLLEHQ